MNLNNGRLELYVDDVRFIQSPPTVATLRVTAGRTYRLKVVDGAPWDYDEMYVPFVLSTSMN